MREYTLVHLRDEVLLRDLASLVAQDRCTTATLLAHLAEVDVRRLYAPAGYPSMHAYCVEELRLSEDAAAKRIQAARTARRFPALFTALAEGRLHLAAVCLLAPHLTQANADELIEAATHRRKSEIEEFLGRRFGRPELPALMQPIAAIHSGLPQHAPGHVGGEASAPVTLDEHAPGHVGESGEPTFAPPERYLLQVTIPRSTREKLRYAQALLSHAVPAGELAQVLDRALDALISKLEIRKFGAAARTPSRQRTFPRAGRFVRKRHVPAHVRRAVWERDQGQCTFVGASGIRCKARRFLEFDHVDPVARGGQATVERMRLRCRAHNQLEAERTFGVEFMARKRHEARLAANEARDHAATAGARTRDMAREARTRAEAQAAAKEQAQDVLAGLRGLGCRADEARRAAQFSETLPSATLEERMRAALGFLGRRSIQRRTPAGAFHPQSQSTDM
jgi:5-methylcytosine-specific restriction endonuclease McrA